MVKNYDWERETTDWMLRRRNTTPELAKAAVRYFELAFAHTANPNQAWFGVHTSRVSLTVGGIWLISVVPIGRREDKGLWLLVDQKPLVKEWNYRPTKSTQDSKSPLNWGHAETISLAAFENANNSEELWQSYASASRKIFDSPVADRVDKKQREAKHRLTEFWKGGNRC